MSTAVSVAGGRRRGTGYGPFWAVLVFAVVLVAAVAVTFRSVPEQSAGYRRADVLLVLGSPADLDGSLLPEQRWRVDEAVREWRAGRAPVLLMSGGAVANQYVEAHRMALYAEQQLGVPATDVLEEGRSRNTLENLRNSQAILDAHHWHSVEVVSTPEHLARAAVLLERTHLQWQVHAAPTPGRGRLKTAGAYAEEAAGTALIRWCGLWILPVLHGVAVVQHGIGWTLRYVVYAVEGWLRRR